MQVEPNRILGDGSHQVHHSSSDDVVEDPTRNPQLDKGPSDSNNSNDEESSFEEEVDEDNGEFCPRKPSYVNIGKLMIKSGHLKTLKSLDILTI